MTPMQNKLYKAAVEKMRHEVALATTTAEASAVHTGKARGRGRKAGLPPVVATNGDPNALVAKLGSQRVNNIFTHLRKVANHPLLIRSVFDDAKASGPISPALVFSSQTNPHLSLPPLIHLWFRPWIQMFRHPCPPL